jgi:hypothetical protein
MEFMTVLSWQFLHLVHVAMLPFDVTLLSMYLEHSVYYEQCKIKKLLVFWGKRRNTLTMANLRHYLALYGQISHTNVQRGSATLSMWQNWKKKNSVHSWLLLNRSRNVYQNI